MGFATHRALPGAGHVHCWHMSSELQLPPTGMGVPSGATQPAGGGHSPGWHASVPSNPQVHVALQGPTTTVEPRAMICPPGPRQGPPGGTS